MSDKKNKERLKNTKQRKSKKSKKIGKNFSSTMSVTSLSKREPSTNWLTFVKSNGIKGKVFKISDEVISSKDKKPKKVNKENPVITKVVALDCEMVSDFDNQNMLARVSIVNYKLECIYDKYVKPTSQVGDYRTRFSGIRKEDVENGEDFEIVRQEVKTILYNKILVGHALHNDFRVLKFGHHRQLIRDTSRYELFKKVSDSKSPSLKKLAKVFLNENIQEGEHNSIEDAKTAMRLYKKFRQDWEISLISSKSKKLDENTSQSETLSEHQTPELKT